MKDVQVVEALQQGVSLNSALKREQSAVMNVRKIIKLGWLALPVD